MANGGTGGSVFISSGLGQQFTSGDMFLQTMNAGTVGGTSGAIAIETGHPTKPSEFVRFSGVCRKTARNIARPVPSEKKGG